MDAKVYKGGSPVIQFPFCEGNYAQFEPPFSTVGVDKLEPYLSHADGAYQIGYFTLGMPIVPKWMPYQRAALADAALAVDDIIQCLWIPADHYAKFLNFKVVGDDPDLDGATVTLTAQSVTVDQNGAFVYTEISDIEDAAAAQGAGAPIALDTDSNTMISLMKVATLAELDVTASGNAVDTPGTVNVTGTAEGDVVGYVQPLYSTPENWILVGLKIASLPHDVTVSLADAKNGWFLSLKVEGFECPMYL